MKFPAKFLRRALFATISCGLSAAALADNVVEKLAARGEFSTLVTAVTEAGLLDTLAAAEDVTIFAPSNDAFARIPEADLNALLADKEALTNVLLYHVSPGTTEFNAFEDGPLDTLLEGETVDIEVKSYFFGWFKTVSVDEARITRSNIRASNGIIHRIDRVLDPGFEPVPTILEIASGNPDFSILAGLVEKAGFARALGSDHVNLTVFAPTNAAFEALGPETLAAVEADVELLRAILRNHLAWGSLTSEDVVSRGTVRTLLRKQLDVTEDPGAPTGYAIDGQPIAAVDIEASNGIIHVIDGVLVPAQPKSLVDVASGREDLSTFVEVLGAAGLAETFDSTTKWPSYTVLAPNNDAFGAIPADVLNTLLADPTGALAEVLKLHVIPGRLTADRLYDGQVLRSLSGQRLTVSISESGEVRFNNALVLETNLGAVNGVIHVLGNVIAPDAFTVADYVGSKGYLATLNAALEAANLKTTLDEADGITLFAPLDYAFARLPEGTVEGLLADPAGDLTQILLYHVLDDPMTADELVEAGSATTLQGGEVEVESRTYRFWGWRFPYSIVTINGNRVISADVTTDNGIIHLLSGVLLPPAG